LGWLNSHLKKRSVHANSLNDLSDGRLLSQLYEILTGKSIKYEKSPKLEFHKISNLDTVIEKFREDNVKVSTGSEDFIKKNEKVMLGFLWSLICRYQLSIDRKNLLEILKRETSSYRDIDLSKPLHESVRDGRLICALVNNRLPNSIDMESISQENAVEYLEKAFSLAQQHLDIPQLLTAEDVCNGVTDEKSLHTYLSYFLKSSQPNQISSNNNVISQNEIKQNSVLEESDKTSTADERLIAYEEREKKLLKEVEQLTTSLHHERHKREKRK